MKIYTEEGEDEKMRYNPINDPGIGAGAEKTTVENHEGEEIANTISSFSFDISGIIKAIKEFFDMIIGLFRK